MNEKLYRAKQIKNGEWIEGTRLKKGYGNDVTMKFSELYKGIHFLYDVKVSIETVCAYTGKEDVNGKKVFEKDILRNCKHPEWCGSVVWDHKKKTDCVYIYVSGDAELPNNFAYRAEEWEVIGNEYDNPELMCRWAVCKFSGNHKRRKKKQ